MASDCPATGTACATPSCVDDACGKANASAGTSCDDSGGKVCDGNGACVACTMPSDCTPPTTACLIATCDAHTCGITNAAKGTSCNDSGGIVCDGNGSCVAMHCMDTVKDADETDVDCGGASCAKCADTKMCLAGGDCTSQVCDSGHHCAVPTCSDAVQNGNETDTDCGGSGYMGATACPKCADTHHCTANADCASNDCAGSNPGTCISCTDGVKNGNETDLDCGGGGSCSACANGKGCGINSDCVSSACDALSLICVASQCNDHRKDGAESDTDCGGGTCSVCANGKSCGINSDCVANACDALSLTCVASQCNDHRKDGAESDVDCGGATCTKCGNGKKCTVNTDCGTNACDALSLLCVANQCADNHQDGAETDVDCGGGICSVCANGKKCTINADCATNACDALSLLCVANQCADHRQDGTESDVDCGGAVCASCTVGKKCNSNSDCQLGHTCNASKVCQ